MSDDGPGEEHAAANGAPATGGNGRPTSGGFGQHAVRETGGVVVPLTVPAADAAVPPVLAPLRPEFEILGATWVPDTSAPMIRFDLRAGEPSGREVFTIALTAQINVDPALRSYDPETRERLVELFGEPDRWPATTHSFLWAHASCLVPSFVGETKFSLTVPCTYDLELAAARYFCGIRDGEIPLSFHFTGSILHRGPDGRVQVILVPWSCSSQWKMPISTWREMMDYFYPNGAWACLHSDTADALTKLKTERGLPSIDAAITMLLREAGHVAPATLAGGNGGGAGPLDHLMGLGPAPGGSE
jgi:hypothetical protein